MERKINKLLVHLSAFILLPFCGCSNTENIIIKEPNNYLDNMSNNFIKWGDVFSQKIERYLIYVFSYDCYFCNQTKECISKFMKSPNLPLYLVEYSKEIPIKSEIEKTIGVCSVDKLFIRGTPTLILINNGTVELNVAGKNDVCSTIELFFN